MSGRPHDTYAHVLTWGCPDELYAACGLYREFKSWIYVLRNSTQWPMIGAEVYKMRSDRIAQLCDTMLAIAMPVGRYAGMFRWGTDTVIDAGVDGVVGAVLTGGNMVGAVGGVVVGGVVGNQVGK